MSPTSLLSRAFVRTVATCIATATILGCGESNADSPRAPRLIAPLSTATVTSQSPTLRWMLDPDTDGAHVEICSDRECTKSIVDFDAAGNSGAPPRDLPS